MALIVGNVRNPDSSHRITEFRSSDYLICEQDRLEISTTNLLRSLNLPGRPLRPISYVTTLTWCKIVTRWHAQINKLNESKYIKVVKLQRFTTYNVLKATYQQIITKCMLTFLTFRSQNGTPKTLLLGKKLPDRVFTIFQQWEIECRRHVLTRFYHKLFNHNIAFLTFRSLFSLSRALSIPKY